MPDSDFVLQRDVQEFVVADWTVTCLRAIAFAGQFTYVGWTIGMNAVAEGSLYLSHH